MTDLRVSPSTSSAGDSLPISHPRLPSWAPALVAVIAVSLSGLLALFAGLGLAALIINAVIIFLIGVPVWSLVLENRRAALDRLMTSLIWVSFSVAVAPLVWLIWMVVSRGSRRSTFSS